MPLGARRVEVSCSGKWAGPGGLSCGYTTVAIVEAGLEGPLEIRRLLRRPSLDLELMSGPAAVGRVVPLFVRLRRAVIQGLGQWWECS